MQIWLSNSLSTLARERALFALICDNLALHCGAHRVVERFETLAALAALPWLDQPRRFSAVQLIAEVHEAWDELWTVPVAELLLASAETSALIDRAVDPAWRSFGERVGGYLARPLYELAVFAASGGTGAIRAGTHRELIEGSSRQWRVIQGGASRFRA